jgi:hypothetical protein
LHDETSYKKQSGGGIKPGHLRFGQDKPASGIQENAIHQKQRSRAFADTMAEKHFDYPGLLRMLAVVQIKDVIVA